MSLNRLFNKDKIIQLNVGQYGQLFSDIDLSLLNNDTVTPYDPRLIDNNIAELHLFTPNGDYLGGDTNANYIVLDDVSNSLLVNVREVFNIAGIDRGNYKIVINLFKKLFGDNDHAPFFIKEISPERTELKLELIPSATHEDVILFQEFISLIDSIKFNDILNHVIFNFGYNRIVKITNIKFDVTNNICYVRLYSELPLEIEEKHTCWSAFEIMDPYIDNVSLVVPVNTIPLNKLKGPNFDIDTDLFNSNSTVYKSWNDLLDTDVTTRGSILNNLVSGSGIDLNIDYSQYKYFTIYSSATERLDNFRYKLQLSEYYKKQIGDISTYSGSSNIYQANVNRDVIQKRYDNVISSFTPFEKWLYYEPTSSIFTHDITGSLTPWPKYVKNGRRLVHHTSASVAVSWYNNNIVSASMYDEQNYNRLTYLTPDHILMDPGNSEYITFLNMMGEHFDDIYTYVNALTSIFERDEHPQRGTPNELLPHIAESMGWKVQNTKQLSELWLYAAGTDQSGSIAEITGSMPSLSHRNLNYQVWRRIVNNMPYLLKTKGTSRSVKALLSIYGIPHTLVSIKEYGGPAKELNKPALIDDHFGYKINFKNNTYIDFPRRYITSSVSNWQHIGRQPDTIEFRFSTIYSGSSGAMSLWGISDAISGSACNANIRLIHASKLYETGSYSGSLDYGILELAVMTDDKSVYYGSTEELPLFDGDLWNVRLSSLHPITSLTPTGSLELQVAKSADCSLGSITYSASLQLDIDRSFYRRWGATGSFTKTAGKTFLGYSSSYTQGVYNYGFGYQPSNFSGSIQTYKEYFEYIKEETFFEHILNPASYHGNSPTSSYYTLYRYWPLGIDSIRHDHTIKTQITSSQPNRALNFAHTASFKNFTGGQSTQYTGFREQHYVYTPSLGGQNIVNDKVRIEDISLLHELSPEARAEKAIYDYSPVDTNRLVIAFSPTDQINREIFNHTGFAELDDYMGDPGDQYNHEYPDLKRFGNEYWKKWARRFDLNEFIKIFSVFDYTVFSQIQQLIPARADYIGGVLVESHVLERNKQPRKKPSATNPQWQKEITYNPKQFGYNLTYTSSISAEGDITIQNKYYTSSVDFNINVDTKFNYYTSSLEFTTSLISTLNYYTSSIRLYDPYTGSRGCTQSIIDNNRTSCRYKKVIYYYSASGNYPNEYRKNFAKYVSMSYHWHYSKSLEDANYQINECGVYNRSRFVGSKLEGADFNIDSPDTIDGGPVVWVRRSNSNIIIVDPNGLGNFKIE